MVPSDELLPALGSVGFICGAGGCTEGGLGAGVSCAGLTGARCGRAVGFEDAGLGPSFRWEGGDDRSVLCGLFCTVGLCGAGGRD